MARFALYGWTFLELADAETLLLAFLRQAIDARRYSLAYEYSEALEDVWAAQDWQ